MYSTKLPIPILALLITVGLSAASFGCQEVEQSQTVLTQSQWNEIKEQIYDSEQEAPTPQYKIGANYDDKIKLIGFDVEEPIVAGEKTKFTWYWKALTDIDKNWKIFVHFDSQNENASRQGRRQNLDHHPMDKKYLTSRWEKGKVYEDIQEVTIRPDYPTGPATPRIGFFRNQTRLPIKNPDKNRVRTTNDRRVVGPTLTVKSGPNTEEPPPKKDEASKPDYDVPLLEADIGDGVTVDGKLDDGIWENVDNLSLSPLGSQKKLATDVRAFVSGEHLFVGAKMEDEHAWGTLEERDSKTWEEEVLEMFVDVDGNGKNYMEFQIAPTGTIFDANFESVDTKNIGKAKKFDLEGLESAVHVEGTLNDNSDDDEFWSVELKIPLASIPDVDGPPSDGDQWAVNLYRFDRPTDDETLAFAWSTRPQGDFHQVRHFGTWTFTSPSDGDDGPKLDPTVIEKLQQKQGAPAGLDLPTEDLKEQSESNE